VSPYGSATPRIRELQRVAPSALTKASVIDNLIKSVERAMQAQPVRDAKGEHVNNVREPLIARRSWNAPPHNVLKLFWRPS
jgi:hypothetical protein